MIIMDMIYLIGSMFHNEYIHLIGKNSGDEHWRIAVETLIPMIDKSN